MIRLLPVFLAVAFLLGSCDSAESGSEPDLLYGFPSIVAPPSLPDSVAEAYAEDAANLAFEIVRETDGDAADIVLPTALRETLFNALGHVWHVNDIPARDSVVSQCDIHVFPGYSLHEIIVAVDTSASWVQAWMNGNVQTGELAIDRITQAWDLTLNDPLNPDCSLCFVVLRTDQSLNTVALAAEFTGIQGVWYAESNGFGGDGNTIDVAPHEDAIELVYSRGFGDCPAGCIGRHYWRFSVAADGSVEFVESYGSPLP